MILELVKKYLEENMNIPVHMEIPADPPKKYLTIQKLDGGKTNQVKAITLSIEAYDESKYKASMLSDKVEEQMESLGESDKVFSCKLGGGGDDTDSISKKYRFETIWNIYY